jgi:crotonobetainyl-CoA:carnitine CoA-transferase CaiB-like acyl-CoA transferase
LAGVRIVDVSQGVSGAYCTKLLAGFGADVLKIEPPGAGDPLRRYGPFADAGNTLETGALHLYLNTAKSSLTLDTSTVTGRALLARLLESADALVDDRPPGVLDDEGFDAQVIGAQYPTLVVTRLSAFGQSGPYANVPATNLTSLAMGGQMAITGDPDREPLKNGGFQADYQCGLNGMVATVAGLWAAQRDGVGDDIDVAAMECMASTLELMLNQYCYTQTDLWSGRRGNIMSSVVGVYPCADGYIGIHAMPRNFPALARLMDSEWMLESEEFGTNAGRLAHEDELRAMVYAWAGDQRKRDVYERAGRLRAPVAYVHEMQDLFDSPQLAARDYLRPIEHPVAGTQTYPGAPWRMSETPWNARRAPLLGEHTEVVLREKLGLSASDIAVLHGNGVV